MQKIVVTGSNGFVGSALTRMLLDLGHEVVPVPRELLRAKREGEPEAS